MIFCNYCTGTISGNTRADYFTTYKDQIQHGQIVFAYCGFHYKTFLADGKLGLEKQISIIEYKLLLITNYQSL